MKHLLFIKWSAGNDMGVDIIDEQHRGIVSIINTFYYMMGSDKARGLICPSISETLKSYSKIHFATEEELMEKAGYPDLENHRELHRKLTVQTDMIENKCLRLDDLKPLLDFLKSWWLNHINQEDEKYRGFLKEYCVSG
ncbi:MAG: bacteriohemerythrin [Desulfovibrio sp.]|jgi:hemerythrin-like metal-binding protein|nr:bacteriohemerythrin [Desulfovibrio sp.]